MGTGSEVEAGGLGWDVPGWGVVWWWWCSAPAADRRGTTRSLQQSKGTWVREYKRGGGPGAAGAVRIPEYLRTWYPDRAGAVRLAGVQRRRDQGETHPWPLKHCPFAFAEVTATVAPPIPNIASAIVL